MERRSGQLFPPFSEAELKEGAAFEDWGTEFIRGYRDALFGVLTSLPGYYGRRRGLAKRLERLLHNGLRTTAAALYLRGEEIVPNLRREDEQE